MCVCECVMCVCVCTCREKGREHRCRTGDEAVKSLELGGVRLLGE